MIGYAKTREVIYSAIDAIDTINEVMRDIRGLACLLHEISESDNEPDPLALTALSDHAHIMADATQAAYTCLEAALTDVDAAHAKEVA